MAVSQNLAMLAALAIGYLLGSIPFGLLLTRAAGFGDVRKIGSGNIGATNVLRTGNKGLAAATLLLDGLKGTLAVHAGALAGAWLAIRGLPGSAAPAGGAVAMPFGGLMAFAAAGGLGAFLGHLYPAWLGFKGGKGVATYIGVLVGLYWPAALVFCIIWLAVAFASRYSSLSALTAAVLTPIVAWLLGAERLSILLAPMTVLLLYTHRANIARLMKGEEPKIGAKA